MTITERYTDMAGNYRYTVEVDATLAIPLKYVTTVTDATVLDDAQTVYDKMVADAELNALPVINFDL